MSEVNNYEIRITGNDNFYGQYLPSGERFLGPGLFDSQGKRVIDDDFSFDEVGEDIVF